MTWLSASVSVLCATIAFALLLASRNRRKLQSRLANIVPGSTGAAEVRVAVRVRRTSKAIERTVDAELPDLIDLMAATIAAEGSLHGALSRVAERASGRFAGELALLLRRVELGEGFSAELSALCERLPTAGVREFANKISIALARGTPLTDTFTALSATLRARQGNRLLASAGSNETKMLIPLVVLVLPTTVIFALYPSVLVLDGTFN
jgi:tight adherence protein C